MYCAHCCSLDFNWGYQNKESEMTHTSFFSLFFVKILETMYSLSSFYRSLFCVDLVTQTPVKLCFTFVAEWDKMEYS